MTSAVRVLVVACLCLSFSIEKPVYWGLTTGRYPIVIFVDRDGDGPQSSDWRTFFTKWDSRYSRDWEYNSDEHIERWIAGR